MSYSFCAATAAHRSLQSDRRWLDDGQRHSVEWSSPDSLRFSTTVLVKNVICLVIDRLHAGMVGPYGNAWIRTPELNHLASESFLLDQALIDSPHLDILYDSYWQKAPAGASSAEGATTLPQFFNRSRVHTALLTDERQVAEHPLASDFAERIFVEPQDADCVAEEVAETQMAQFFATAQEWLSGAREPFFLWLHSRGMAASWDAPLEMRNSYAEEDDPTPPELAQVPCRVLRPDYNPDELLGVTQAYAAQVSLLDMCLGALLEDFRQGPLAENTLLALVSARGFPLGEHLRIGSCDEALYNELVQLVWLLRFPDGLGRLTRSQALVQPPDLPATILPWYFTDAGTNIATPRGLLPIVEGQVESLRDRALIVASDTEMALRTPAWYLRRSGPAEGPKVELFAKPSDRWEVNEISSRMNDIAVQMHDLLEQTRQIGKGSELQPLGEELVTPVD